MENLAKYMKFLETSRNGVVSNIVVNAVEDRIGFYTDDVDWDEVEETLEACSSSGWLIYTQDIMEFYSKNYKEVDVIVSQDDAFSVDSFSVIDAISSACYRAYNIVLSNIVNQLKAL